MPPPEAHLAFMRTHCVQALLGFYLEPSEPPRRAGNMGLETDLNLPSPRLQSRATPPPAVGHRPFTSLSPGCWNPDTRRTIRTLEQYPQAPTQVRGWLELGRALLPLGAPDVPPTLAAPGTRLLGVLVLPPTAALAAGFHLSRLDGRILPPS